MAKPLIFGDLAGTARGTRSGRVPAIVPAKSVIRQWLARDRSGASESLAPVARAPRIMAAGGVPAFLLSLF